MCRDQRSLEPHGILQGHIGAGGLLHAPDRCNITAVPADSKTVISAGTCRPRRRAREKVSAAPRLLLRAPDPRETLKFAGDSPLEGGGFELSVPGDGQSRC